MKPFIEGVCLDTVETAWSVSWPGDDGTVPRAGPPGDPVRPPLESLRRAGEPGRARIRRHRPHGGHRICWRRIPGTGQLRPRRRRSGLVPVILASGRPDRELGFSARVRCTSATPRPYVQRLPPGSAGRCHEVPSSDERCHAVLITQRSRVQIPPPLPSKCRSEA